MNWTNPGLVKAKNYDAEHFTTDFAIRFRRFLHPLIHTGIRIAVDRPVDIIRYPNLPRGKNYIFTTGHSFPGEIASNLSVIDRKTWVLLGTTDKVDHNPQMLAAFTNAMR